MCQVLLTISNRVVLDGQLQDTINSFEHKVGLVEAIDDKKNSHSLAEAINDGKKIIISTVQKFLFGYKDMDSYKGKKFAVIIDEAHQGQSSESARMLHRSLIDIGVAVKEYAEEQEIDVEDVDLTDEFINSVVGQGRHANQSFFAFTATPKGDTIEVFVDSDQNPISVDGSSYMDVSGSGVLFSGGAADYYGGVIDAQGEVTLFDAPSLAVEGGKVLAPDGAVISLDGGKASSLDIKNANVKAKSYGADVISGSKSHLEFPKGCGETTDLKLNTCTAVINGTGFTTDFEFSKSVVIFPEAAAADDLRVVSDYSSYDTGKGGTVFCNEFVTSSSYYVDGRGLGVLSEGDHRGMYYDGDQPLIVRDGVTVSEANYITSPNTIVFAAGSMSAYYSYSAKINYDDPVVAGGNEIKRAPTKPVLLEPTNINDAVITAISTGKGVNGVFFHNNAISLYNVNMSESSLFAGTTTEYNSINVCFAGSKDTSTSNDCTFIAIGDISIGIIFSILNNSLEKFSGIAIASGRFDAGPSLLDGRVTCDCSSYAYHMVIDGKVTETNAVSKSSEVSLQVRNGSFWCGVVGTRLTTTTKDPDEKLLVHRDAIDTTYIYAALKGTDKYYEYTQLARNEDNKIYIGRKIYEPYINIVEPENKTLTRGGTTEIAYVTYGCTDPVLEWVNADGEVISAPDGITASLGDTSIDRKVSITTHYDVPEETVRFRIRSRDGNNIVSNVLELTTGKYNFMMDFRDSKYRKIWKFGVEVTDRNDIAALVKNAISQIEMQLYSDITAQYGLTERADNNVRVYAARKAGNENALDDLMYPKAAFPTETVEKYRAAAEKLAQDPTSNAVTLDGDTMVTRTSLG